MACYAYQDIKFTRGTLELIETMNEVITAFVAEGFRLTVRQLYYQLVARAVIPNSQQSYAKICTIVNNARLAGVMDWDAIEDRTRAFVRRQRWESGTQILEAATGGFHMDMWDNQHFRVYVIIEKEALVGVFEPLCRQFDIPLLAARGYPSVTVVREFVLSDIIKEPSPTQAIQQQKHIILHLGDHDPSGIDMTRDLRDRIDLFCEGAAHVELKRIALNMAQIEEQQPPPNPAKTTDSRFESYQREYGVESWELDALPPTYLNNLLKRELALYINQRAWKARADYVETIRSKLQDATERMRDEEGT